MLFIKELGAIVEEKINKVINLQDSLLQELLFLKFSS